MFISRTLPSSPAMFDFADDQRLEQRDGIQLSKEEVLAVVLYVQVWQQR